MNSKLSQNYNSYGGKLQRILSFLKDNAPQTVTPLEIAQHTKLNVNTVRVYVRCMAARGVICRPFYGHYTVSPTTPATIPTDVVGGAGDEFVGVGAHRRWHGRGVHNLILGVDMPRGVDLGGEDVFEFGGGVKIRFQYGRKRRRITIWVSCNGATPIDVGSFPFVVTLIKDKLLLKTGYEFGDLGIDVVSFELHEDFNTMRMEGVKSVTLKSFTGMLERIYNKGGGLRSEVKGRVDNVASIYAALKGGVSTYNVLQLQYMVLQRLEALVQSVKFQNENMQNLFGVVQRLLERGDKA